jgi:asparagine synthase (glutamine-hydrolysing)
MCGIAGFVDYGIGYGVERLKNIVLAMRETMVHRGPDDCGLWVDESGMCALSHRRLSIIDLSSHGRQPMGNEDKTVHVTFNGEIYNFQQLRKQLQSEGHRYRDIIPFI